MSILLVIAQKERRIAVFYVSFLVHIGSIDANEFSAILVNEFCHTEVPRGHIVDAATMKPWVVPKTGGSIV